MGWLISIFFGGLVLAHIFANYISNAHVLHLLFTSVVTLSIAIPLYLDWQHMQRELFVQRHAVARPRLTLAQTLLVLFSASIELGGAMNVLQDDRPILGVFLMLMTPVLLYVVLETMEVRGPFSIYRCKIDLPKDNGLFWTDEPIQERKEKPPAHSLDKSPIEASHPPWYRKH